MSATPLSDSALITGRASSQPSWGELKADRPVEHFETVRVRKDGTHVPVWLTVLRIRDEGGSPIGASTIMHDHSGT